MKHRWLPLLAALFTRRPLFPQLRTAVRLMLRGPDLPEGQFLIMDNLVVNIDGGWHRQWTLRNGRETLYLHTDVTEHLGELGEAISLPPK